MGISTPRICLSSSLSKTRDWASLHPTRNATQWLPKWLLNSLSLHNRMTCELLPRKVRKESGKSSPVSPGHRSKMAARRPWSFFLEMNLAPEQSHFLQNLRLHLIDLSRRLEQDVNEDVTDLCVVSVATSFAESFVKAGSRCGFRCIQLISNLYACPKGTIYQDLFIYIKIDLYISSFIYQC